MPVVDPDSMGALLDAPVPVVSEADAVEIARALFGLSVTATRLTGERDANFHLRGAGGDLSLSGAGGDYALRVINPAEDPAVSDFQSSALVHLAEVAPGVPVPRLHRALDGGLEARWAGGSGPAARVRVLDYLPGRPLVPGGPEQCRAVGACLARLDLGLQGFCHPAQGHRLLWDMQHAADLRALVRHVPDPDDRALVAGVLDRFEAEAVPVLGGLRRQVIHNDFNPHNILVDPEMGHEVVGIIDFGDMVSAPLVQDLATACAYQITEDGHPMTGPAELAAAFHAVLPLTPSEIGILSDLIATRLAMTVLISGLRARRQPENAPYILRNFGRSIAGLRRCAAVPRAEAHALLQERLSA